LVLSVCSLAAFFLSVSNTIHPPLLPLIRGDLGLSYTDAGMLTTGYFVGYSIGQIPWGYLSDRHHRGRAITLSVLGTLSFTFLLGFARSGSEAVLWRFLAGLLGAGIFITGVKLISELFDSSRRGLAIGLYGASTSLGPIFSGLMAPLIATAYDWRWSLMTCAGLGLLVVALTATTLCGQDVASETVEASWNLNGVYRTRSFWALGFVQFLRLGTTYGLTTWIPTFLHEMHALDLPLASFSLVSMSAVGIFANPLGGWLADRLGEQRVIGLSYALLTPCYLLFALSTDLATLFLVILLLGLLTNVQRSPSFAMLPHLYGLGVYGRVLGFQNTFAAVGAFVFPLLLGYLRDATSLFAVGWMTLALCSGAGLLVSTVLLRRAQSPARS
jgi:MFS family permease